MTPSQIEVGRVCYDAYRCPGAFRALGAFRTCGRPSTRPAPMPRSTRLVSTATSSDIFAKEMRGWTPNDTSADRVCNMSGQSRFERRGMMRMKASRVPRTFAAQPSRTPPNHILRTRVALDAERYRAAAAASARISRRGGRAVGQHVHEDPCEARLSALSRTRECHTSADRAYTSLHTRARRHGRKQERRGGTRDVVNLHITACRTRPRPLFRPCGAARLFPAYLAW